MAITCSSLARSHARTSLAATRSRPRRARRTLAVPWQPATRATRAGAVASRPVLPRLLQCWRQQLARTRARKGNEGQGRAPAPRGAGGLHHGRDGGRVPAPSPVPCCPSLPQPELPCRVKPTGSAAAARRVRVCRGARCVRVVWRMRAYRGELRSGRAPALAARDLSRATQGGGHEEDAHVSALLARRQWPSRVHGVCGCARVAGRARGGAKRRCQFCGCGCVGVDTCRLSTVQAGSVPRCFLRGLRAGAPLTRLALFSPAPATFSVPPYALHAPSSRHTQLDKVDPNGVPTLPAHPPSIRACKRVPRDSLAPLQYTRPRTRNNALQQKTRTLTQPFHTTGRRRLFRGAPRQIQEATRIPT